jgi:DNA-binding XRE family transcriptional regulator
MHRVTNEDNLCVRMANARTIAELLADLGRTQASLAQELEVSTQAVNGWLRGVVPASRITTDSRRCLA